ncbi:MAG: ParB/RepB/Spo0J family partition protein [Synergistaceae bacterium]|nr:ParB/RepB/Spo0J family partition protein [Synergistaceae bacterium]
MSEVKKMEFQEKLLDELENFRDNPFFVPDENDKSIQALAESIKENGIMTPLVVRAINNGKYEIISGHRRKLACKLAGLDKIPVIVKVYKSDDEAMSAVINANLHRKKMLPSDKARVYKARYEILKHQGRNEAENNGEIISGDSFDIIAKTTGESKKTVQRYITLAKLIPDLLQMVDKGRLLVTCGVSIAALDKEKQTMLFEEIKDRKKSIKLADIDKIKEADKNDQLTKDKIKEILSKTTALKFKAISISAQELKKYFDDSVDKEFIKNKIFSLLEKDNTKS